MLSITPGTPRENIWKSLGSSTLEKGHLPGHRLQEAVEVDERQHEIYEPSCEFRRLVELLAACMGKPLVVIRYNPDGYEILGETQRTSAMKRQTTLIDTIRHYEKKPPDEILTVEYICYTDIRQSELETELATQLDAYVSAGE